MAVYALGEQIPDVDPTAYVSEHAVVIGDVTIGARSTIWPGAVLRGDLSSIRIGSVTSIQDNAVIHAGDLPTSIGSRCTVGHLAHLEGCDVADDCLIGASSVVLAGARIGRGAMVAAGALVPGSLAVPAWSRAVGVPARITSDVYSEGHLPGRAEVYAENGVRHSRLLRRIG
jgi:carbonic anhydrase/acetyltransferase-like protein (isoleucine patch superfamily)